MCPLDFAPPILSFAVPDPCQWNYLFAPHLRVSDLLFPRFAEP